VVQVRSLSTVGKSGHIRHDKGHRRVVVVSFTT
jgi:hypothetical protein